MYIYSDNSCSTCICFAFLQSVSIVSFFSLLCLPLQECYRFSIGGQQIYEVTVSNWVTVTILTIVVAVNFPSYNNILVAVTVT